MVKKEEEGTTVYREEKKKREQEMTEEQKKFEHPKYGAQPGEMESAEESYGTKVGEGGQESQAGMTAEEREKKRKEAARTGTAEAR